MDATGLLLTGSGAWRANKDPEDRKDFCKIHEISGTQSRATLAIRTTRGTWHDSTQLPQLLQQVPQAAAATALTADSAYWSHELSVVGHP